MRNSLLISFGMLMCLPMAATPQWVNLEKHSLLLPDDAPVMVSRMGSDGHVQNQVLVSDKLRKTLDERKKAKAGATLHTVRFINDSQNPGYPFFQGAFVFNSDRQLIDYLQFEDEYQFQLPAGNYTFEAIFATDHNRYVFVDQTVSGDTDVHVASEMADQWFSIEYTLPNGEPVVLPPRDDNGNPVGDDYNTDGLWGVSRIAYKGMQGIYSTFWADLGGWYDYTDFLTFKTNVTGPDVDFYWNTNGVTKDKVNFNISTWGTADQVTGRFTNTAEDFTQLTPTLGHTPAYKTYGNNNTFINPMLMLYKDGDIVTGCSRYAEEDWKIYAVLRTTDFTGMYCGMQFNNGEIQDQQGNLIGVTAPPIFRTEEGLVYGSSQYGLPIDIYAKGLSGTPVNPDFSFPTAEEQQQMGTTAPYLTTCTDASLNTPNNYSTPYVCAAYGNNGEMREVDLYFLSQEEVESDTPGFHSIKFIDSNSEVNGIATETECTVTYNESNEDCMPPTVTRLMLRDSDGNPTNQFQSPADVNLTLSAGDFKPIVTFNDAGHWTYRWWEQIAGVTVEAAYAPADSDNYGTFLLKADPERVGVPAYGNYYTGNLGNENMVFSTDGWFNLRITVTDVAGNKQEQKIGRAFYVKALDSIEKVESDNHPVAFTAVNGKIEASDGSAVAVYTLSGSRLANNSLASGIYIARSGGRSAKVIVK